MKNASIDTFFGSRPTSSVPLRLYVCFKLRIIKELGLLAAIVEKLDIRTLFLAPIEFYVSDGLICNHVQVHSRSACSIILISVF